MHEAMLSLYEHEHFGIASRIDSVLLSVNNHAIFKRITNALLFKDKHRLLTLSGVHTWPKRNMER